MPKTAATIEVRGREDGLVSREIDGEVVLVDTKADRVHQLNVSASLIWRMCVDGATAEATAEVLASRFDVGQHQASADVHETLEKFLALGLIRCKD